MRIAQIVGGSFQRVIARERSSARVEIGELLIARGEPSYLFQVTNTVYGSQLSQQHVELISGMSMEEDAQVTLFEQELRSYRLLELKMIVAIDSSVRQAKTIPDRFTYLERVKEEDVAFLKGDGSLFVGNIRSGSRLMQGELLIDGASVIPHHVLIAAQTGKGKSNLTKCILEGLLHEHGFGMLVLDPHDEYFGRVSLGLKDSLAAAGMEYYSPITHPRARQLRIARSQVKPEHVRGVMQWSVTQEEALFAYYRKYREGWIDAILTQEDDEFMQGTMNVLKRRMRSLFSEEIFSEQGSSLMDMVHAIEQGKLVLVDTSVLSGPQEVVVGSIIASTIFERYRRYKRDGSLHTKPVVGIVIEEAPRVLGKAVLQQGSNVFEQIAREGRKFNVGLVAITQVPSQIPREILANMNTKIVLGLEMAHERSAIIESAAQDISDLSSQIASLEKGEAIISSSFTRFAIPIKAPLFESRIARKERPAGKVRF